MDDSLLLFRAIRDSRNIHITGTGDPAHFYGIEIKNPGGNAGIISSGKSKGTEIDHVEIHHTGAGIRGSHLAGERNRIHHCLQSIQGENRCCRLYHRFHLQTCLY